MNIVYILIGVVIGLIAAYLLRIFKTKTAQQLASELFTASEVQRHAESQALADRLKAEVVGLSNEALDRNSDRFLALAGERLASEARDILGQRETMMLEFDSKRGLIDQRLGAIADRFTADLLSVQATVKTLENDRRQALGQVTERLDNAGQVITQLTTVTTSLREALRSTKQRGQWGERMAEDVLRAAGFIDGINYMKQSTLVDGVRPDFTFLLPKDRTVNMDVKFPMDNYLRMQEAATEIEQARFKKDFLKDVRLRMKEITSKTYIDAGTCDYVIMFIPNESLLAFIQSEDPQLLDDAVRQHVVMCAPYTLFAVLAVIRQAVDQFAMEKTTSEIIALIGAFHKQWAAFVEQMDRVGKRIEDTNKEFEALSGVRRRQLEKPLGKIEDLRAERQLPAAEDVAIGA